MAHQARLSKQTTDWLSLPATITLTLWQLRQTWRLLLLVGLGMVAAVVLLCAIPLYSQIATTAGLRDILVPSGSHGTITISGTAQQISPSSVQHASQVLDLTIHTYLGPYLSPAPQFSVDVGGLASHALDSQAGGDQLELVGATIQQAASHVHIVQGRLPRLASNTVEIALTPQEARQLHTRIGDVLTMSVFYTVPDTGPAEFLGNPPTRQIEHDLKLPVVGLFMPLANDPFWQQQDFQSTQFASLQGIFMLYHALLLLRGFPVLLRLISHLVERRRSAALPLALAQMARTPRHILRMILLLSLSISFALFTLVFTASQAQRAADVAAYQVGADFSGVNTSNVLTSKAPTTLSTLYQHIPGVISATVGQSTIVNALVNDSSFLIGLRAVDADTFARTAIWSSQYSTEPLAALTAPLAVQRTTAIAHGIVPALVDANGWSMLHLRPGVPISLNDGPVAVDFLPIAQIQRLPTVNDAPSSNALVTGGILVDFQTFAAVFKQNAMKNPNNFTLNGSTRVYSGPTIKPTQVWLRTRDGAQALASVRQALSHSKLQLTPVNDRRALIQVLYNDPLYRDLIGILLLGTFATMLLALVGDLTTSWLTARGRLTSFALLRALGSTPKQIAGVLLWEQSVVYGIAIILGVGFGALLSILALPSLILISVNASTLSSAANIEDIYTLQNILPVQVVVPGTLLLALCVITALYIVASGVMVRVVAKPSMSQVLRLNED